MQDAATRIAELERELSDKVEQLERLCPFGKRACEENRAAVVSEHDIEAARNANGTR
jgi:hypothetical protein